MSNSTIIHEIVVSAKDPKLDGDGNAVYRDEQSDPFICADFVVKSLGDAPDLLRIQASRAEFSGARSVDLKFIRLNLQQFVVMHRENYDGFGYTYVAMGNRIVELFPELESLGEMSVFYRLSEAT